MGRPSGPITSGHPVDVGGISVTLDRSEEQKTVDIPAVTCSPKCRNGGVQRVQAGSVYRHEGEGQQDPTHDDQWSVREAG